MKRFLSLIALAAAASAFAQGESTNSSVLQGVEDAVKVLEKYNVAIDADGARAAVVEAMVRKTDPAARVMTTREAAAELERASGVVYELGVRIGVTNKKAVITEVLAGSSAEKAGLAAGEVVDALDNGDISGMKASEIAEMLRGDPDVTAKFKIRGTNDAVREVEVAHDRTQAPAIAMAEELPAGLRYLKLNGFYERSGKDVVSTLRGWMGPESAGVIIDLRGANGLDLQSAADAASLFSPSGSLLFSLRDPNGQDLQVFKSSAGFQIDSPVIVLVDSDTRGAAEVLAAALAGGAHGVMLVGGATRGDPAVRELIDLPDGGKLYMLTRRLVVANGTVYDGREGVKPDLTVTGSFSGEYEPEPIPVGREPSLEEKEDKLLRERVRGDAALQRAADVLLGLKALNIRGNGRIQNP